MARTAARVLLLSIIAMLAVVACGEADERSEADERNEPASPSTPEAPVATPLVTRSLRLEQAGWRFDVDTRSDADGTRVEVLVRTATVGAAPARLRIELDDPVAEGFATDLDGDYAPELLLWTRADGSSAEGDVRGWRFAADGAATMIALPELDGDLATGWRGRDQFGVQGMHLVRSFPLYRDEDDNANPSAGFVRVIRYALDADGLHVAEAMLEPMEGTPQAEVLAR
jgi:hypothetical protein